MNTTIMQVIYCNNTENPDNYVRIEKHYENSIIPRIGEAIYNYIWDDVVETRVADVCYDLDKNCCDIILEKRVTHLGKDEIAMLAESHGWKKTI